MFLLSCHAPGPPRTPGNLARSSADGPPAAALPPDSLLGAGEALAFAQQTGSPRWVSDAPWRLPECVAYERPLATVAAAIASGRARGVASTDMKDVVVLLRAQGSPHVWPRVWVLEAQALTEERLLSEWTSWVSGERSLGQRRCGIARLDASGGRTIVAVVVVDVLADLAPLPLRARVGQWLRLDASLLAAARSAKLLILGPDQSPRAVPSTLTAGAFHSAFSLDRQGFWRLQLLLDVGFGPQPALEAWTFVDVEPGLEAVLAAAPGGVPEPPAGASPDVARSALWSMIDAARRSQGLASLQRDPRLDDLAQAHAEAMLRNGRTAHDAGYGLPLERVARAGVGARRVGENVARASSLERAHRVLWDSPSHRGNLLDPGYDAIGIGVVTAGAGDVLVCELFADYGEVVTWLPSPGRAASRSPSPEQLSSHPLSAPQFSTNPLSTELVQRP